MMKHFFIYSFLLFIIIFVVAQTLQTQRWKNEPIAYTKGEKYLKEWEEVSKKEKEGLPKSALEIVGKILEKSRKGKNYPQIIKCLIHLIKYKSAFEEDALILSIQNLEKETTLSPFPAKPILQSILAELYWNYYQQNRYRFLNRTESTTGNTEDIHNWDLNTIFRKISSLYVGSLQNSDSLQRVSIDYFEDILIEKKENRKLRPSLFDLIAHRALVFFEHEERMLNKPADIFQSNSFSALLPSKEFIKHKFHSDDTLNLQFRALLLYQKLILFHQNDSLPSSLIITDLERLNFCRKITNLNNKDSVYLSTLENLYQSYKNISESAEITYSIANYYSTVTKEIEKDGKKFPPRKVVYELCTLAIKNFPKSSGAEKCKELISRILQKEIRLNCEKTTAPLEPFRISVSYRNVKDVFFRVYRADFTQFNKQRYYTEKERLSHILSQELIDSWKQELPVTDDFDIHSVELKLKGVKKGFYILLCSDSTEFVTENNHISQSYFWSTELSLLNIRNRSNQNRFYVINAQNGRAIAGVSVKTYFERYNYKSREYEIIQGKNFISDKEGKFEISSSHDYERSNIKIELINNDDSYTSDEMFNSRFYEYNQQETKRTFFFTDRKIYRPGQTVYFKGIALKIDPEGKNHSVVKDYNTKVTFFDVNYQKIQEQNLNSNEFGSFSGTFSIPSGLLNGQMTISDANGSLAFSVEEYKRPKFKVAIINPDLAYRLNDTVSINGNAVTYSGVAVDGAKVQFRVKRKTYFPYWRYCWGFPPVLTETFILSGISQTDSKGDFTVRFKAIPSEETSLSQLPEFTYEVNVDITDKSGETRSAVSMVKVGKVALSLQLNLPEMIQREKGMNLGIESENLSGQFEPAKGKIRIEQLKEPERIFRKRLWNKPDQFIINKEDYYKNFPFDIYNEENNYVNWNVGKKILETGFDTKVQKNISVKSSDLETGIYIVKLFSKDKYGTEVNVEKYITVYSVKDKKLPLKKPHFFVPVAKDILETTSYQNKKIGEYEPGETVQFLWGSAHKNAQVRYELEQQGKIIISRLIESDNSQNLITIPITEEYRGGLTVHLNMIYANRHYSEDYFVNVPWTNKELKLEFSTFRDKLQPGEKENWKITVKGKLADKFNAEMLATLYDASLDQFVANDWSFSIWQNFYSQVYTSIGSTFSLSPEFRFENRWNIPYYYPNSREFDQLNFFGYSGGNYNSYNKSIRTMAGTVGNAAPSPRRGGDKDKAEMEMAPAEAMMKADDMTLEPTSIQTPALSSPDKPVSSKQNEIIPRRNMNETAFFYPQLTTNPKGEIEINFTIPEALTQWRFMGLSHTSDLKIGFIEKMVMTQKDLMVQANPPRFFREGDELIFPVKLSNVTSTDLSGEIRLDISDALSQQTLNTEFSINEQVKKFSISKQSNVSFFWKLKIPSYVNPVNYKVIAKTENFSDGEEMAVVILPNRILVTESLPLSIRAQQTKTFEFKKLLQSGSSNTLKHYNLCFEFTQNPVWYAVQALPYLTEFPHECAEQIFSRFYANALAFHIANSDPGIKRVFESWKTSSSGALVSNLEKNEELKSLLLQETPWVRDGQNETEQKNRIALLFDENNLMNNLQTSLRKLADQQNPDGGWSWFPGMPGDLFITQHILIGLSRLQHLKIQLPHMNLITEIVRKGLEFCDEEMLIHYNRVKTSSGFPKDNFLSNIAIHYLYLRSFQTKKEPEQKFTTGFEFWKEQAKNYWLQQGLLSQAMLAIVFKRLGSTKYSDLIINSLKEHSLQSEEMGMYWKNNGGGYFWHQQPVETQSMLIEAFTEVTNDVLSADEMKIWLLKQKQVQNWKTTKATADACYALLLRGTNLLTTENNSIIKLAGKPIETFLISPIQKDAGSGYFKTSWKEKAIKPEMGKVEISQKGKSIGWGALHWQYFETLDKITPHQTPLKLIKKIFRQVESAKGVVIVPVSDTTKLSKGDLIKIRIELSSDRDMEYVHLKDMRASGLEPVHVLSTYRYQDGLGYYESVKDGAVHFYISWMNKGNYVFEYPLRVSHSGVFQNGIAEIQCMYAPEFNAHSEGKVIRVE